MVSLSWMTAVSLIPSQDRPYVDGSPDDSVYTQVFDYNGLGRLTGNWAKVAGPPSPLVVAAKESGRLLNAETIGIKTSWHRLLAGPFAAGGGYLGNVPAPTLATLQADISRGYVRGFALPVSPPGPDPRVRWIESHCTRQPPPPHRRLVPYASFFCGLGPASRPANAATGAPIPRIGRSR